MFPGRGIVHAEMPASRDAPAIGLQLWLNLPARLKMTDPKYQEIPASGLPRAKDGNVRAIIIAGEAMGLKAGTVDGAKTTLVAFFRDHKVTPNPAQDAQTKRYIIGLQKYNRIHNLDDEKKVHPLSVHELSTLMN
ncbi:hypothetical protein DYB32_009907 [Aphanomyces invadans]|uniref:Pirin N-terminal domain-containing protein n=1 Tax=Aphanomyces invadans TaxID=157072 RepID=A0A3R6WEU3_9STRA|nr:hypothetical protein DYB32_009907 [Aphanomyces invadans]